MEILYRTVGVNVKWDTRAFTDAIIPRTAGWDKRTDLEEMDATSSVEAKPPVMLARQEEHIVTKIRKAQLFVFLRHHRHALFDEAFQEELAS